MKTTNISVEQVEEGDVILVDGELKLIEDLYENGRMDGVWLRFAGGHDRFYSYSDTVQRSVTNEDVAQDIVSFMGLPL